MKIQTKIGGFTLVEMMVVVSIIGILSSIVYANFGAARAVARDDVRKSALKETQLALELYKAQYGSYPATGCGVAAGIWAGPGPTGSFGSAQSCNDYIPGLVPDFVAALPIDPNQENEPGMGYYYRSDGSSYKLLNNAVEQKLIGNFDDEFSRCPQAGAPGCVEPDPVGTEYAVYSAGAVQW
ncbi:MAG: prepilin-type N-terminal cleavage/methylation domain-containing protein [Candidatus Pacebacteria bacterium]|jgi:prepilin-type N-terminal cleavage/methylation domain-containing protein|nr:prepilin-type N-terminal cleavage/methylation domain-containing protein [Candidatus Paceibacterota bacterium]